MRPSRSCLFFKRWSFIGGERDRSDSADFPAATRDARLICQLPASALDDVLEKLGALLSSREACDIGLSSSALGRGRPTCLFADRRTRRRPAGGAAPPTPRGYGVRSCNPTSRPNRLPTRACRH